jgi:hypothetical protein
MVLVQNQVPEFQAHSVGIDPVKDRLNSLETAFTILKLLNAVYPPTSWTQAPSDDDETRDIWTLRATISSWGWRTISELKDVTDESKRKPLVDLRACTKSLKVFKSSVKTFYPI